ncbi:MAG: hypothetical protein JW801_09340 [Bacteroidales bacterium]|nr:hypothetical protein [Bacteroidales bacterium]
MKRKLIYLLLASSLGLVFNNEAEAQSHFSKIVRLSNSNYYPIDSLSADKLVDRNMILGGNITERYIVLNPENDSIGISFQDTLIFFHRKSHEVSPTRKLRSLPPNNILINPNLKIKSIKIIEIDKNNITAELSLKKINSNLDLHKKEIIKISKSEVKGVYLGNSKKFRNFSTYLLSGAILVGIILVYL